MSNHTHLTACGLVFGLSASLLIYTVMSGLVYHAMAAGFLTSTGGALTITAAVRFAIWGNTP